MLAIWSLVPLPFLNPAWTSGNSWFTYCWSLAWRILSITLLACSPGHLPNPGIKPRSPALQVDSLPAEPQGKPNNAGVGGLSLLQGIFPAQESNQGLLHCRQILYQLSYERLSLSAQLSFSTMAIINIHPTLWPSDSRTFLSELSEYCFTKKQDPSCEASFNLLPPNVRTHLQALLFFASLITEVVISPSVLWCFFLSYLGLPWFFSW